MIPTPSQTEQDNVPYYPPGESNRQRWRRMMRSKSEYHASTSFDYTPSPTYQTSPAFSTSPPFLPPNQFSPPGTTTSFETSPSFHPPSTTVLPTPYAPEYTPTRRMVRSMSGYQHKEGEKALVFHPSMALNVSATKLDVKRVLIIYNPASGAKRGKKVMQSVKQTFLGQRLAVETIELQRRNHATEICMDYDFADIDVVCVIGGDGTFHEVVNGLMKRPYGSRIPALSPIPAGTGNSMVIELQGISSIKMSSADVMLGIAVPLDILKVTVFSLGKDDHPLTMHTPLDDQNKASPSNLSTEAISNIEMSAIERAAAFPYHAKKEVIYAFNSIHWGLGSRVIETAEKLRWMGHAIRYTMAGAVEVVKGFSTTARILMEDASGVITEYIEEFCLIIANNIGTAAKGMKMAPKAKINDGLIDVILVRSNKTIDLIRMFEKVYSGTHVDLPYVEYKQVRKFCVIPYKPTGEKKVVGDPEIAEEVIDIDGELKGCTPFIVEVMPTALQMII